MEIVKKAESVLAGLFKNAPKMSSSAKETLAKAWPWIALVFGVLQLWAAWILWDLVRAVDKVSTYFGVYLSDVYGYSSKDKFFIYLGLAVLVLDAVILLMAYPKLVKRQKKGWELIFLGALLNGVYSVLNLFISGRGFSDFFFALLGSAIGFYLLFQVKEKYSA